MLVPQIMKCPDRHFRRVIFGLGSYIADYPEQVLLAGIVQNWCERLVIPQYCRAPPTIHFNIDV